MALGDFEIIERV
jgi:hypothetical protein